MTKRTPKGAFVVFEGIDGSGTTTQLHQATEWLQGQGELVHPTREPSYGPIGALLRQVLSSRLQSRDPSGRPAPVDPATVALLFAGDRLDHLQSEIVPAQQAGYHVLSDRYVLSSLAYQSQGVDLKFVRQANAKAVAPDLTIYLRVRPETAMGRIDATRKERDTFETLPFLKTVARAYDQLVADYRGGKVVTIDGEEPPNVVARRVRSELQELLF